LNQVKPDKNDSGSIHIILVDDDLVLLDTMKELLEAMGYIVTPATGSIEAIALMKNILFDVVITDYAMPEMNGLQLALHARKILGDTPVILYTGSNYLIDNQQIARAGIDEVVRKPCSIADLNSTIKKVIAKNKIV